MPLRVAFDLDGTLADMFGALEIEAEKLFGQAAVETNGNPAGVSAAVTGGDIEGVNRGLSRFNLTEQQRGRLWRRVSRIPDFWLTLSETEPGIIKRVAAVSEERRWEVIFLTTRPAVAGATTQLQSQEWLVAHGFRWPSVYVVQRSRGRIAEALELDAVVDDRAQNCLDVALESTAQPILVRRVTEKDVLRGAGSLGVRVVSSVAEALVMLEKLDDAKTGAGLTRRIRRLFGRQD
jgi:hypothetical protein